MHSSKWIIGLAVLLTVLAFTASGVMAADKPAEEAAAVAATAVAEEAPVAASAEVPAIPAAPSAPAAAGEKPVDDYGLENLEFVSGEVVEFSADTKALKVKVTLDEEGNTAQNTVEVKLTDKTEITDGEKDLKADALKAGADIDVEYENDTKNATYIFLYE